MTRIRTALVALAVTGVSCGALATPAVAAPTGPAPLPAGAPVFERPAPGTGAPDWPITGQATVHHPKFGKVLVTTMHDAASQQGWVGVTQGTNSYLSEGFVQMTSLTLPAQDVTGNIILQYNNGRLPGLVVLKPIDVGYSIIADAYPHNSRTSLDFLEAGLVQQVGAPHVIRTARNTCTPTCAQGTIVTNLWRWNGTTYVMDAVAAPKPPAPETTPAPAPRTTPAAAPKAAPTATPAPKATPSPAAERAPETAPTPATTRPAAAASSPLGPVNPIVPAAGAGVIGLIGGAGYLLSRKR